MHFRLGLLVERSFKQNKYNGWREDGGIRQLLGNIFSPEKLKTFYVKELPTFHIIIASLENEFLGEAKRVMSGSKFFAE